MLAFTDAASGEVKMYHPPVENLKIDKGGDCVARHESYHNIACGSSFLQLELKFSLPSLVLSSPHPIINPSPPNRFCYPLLRIDFQLLLPKLITFMSRTPRYPHINHLSSINSRQPGVSVCLQFNVRKALCFSLTNAQMLHDVKKTDGETLRHKNRDES
uniref:Uncharacterized protein n=1 Tax=Glossina pallidipes TaxID=7398 RepID=A0A1B0A301_GLOPL